CKNDCTVNVCGDGAVRTGIEQCDDGNLANGDGCTSGCVIETGWRCPAAGGPCQGRCGDGLIRGAEACDDANLIDGDGCDSNCTLTGCGNGIVTIGEQCDDGNHQNDDACHNDCTLNNCGDGVVETGVEQCDDGNAIDGDGCGADCRREVHFTCYVARTAARTPRFTPVLQIPVLDRFGNLTIDAKKPVNLCTPASQGGFDAGAPTLPDHLHEYQIASSSGTPKFARLLNRTVVNHFGTLAVDVIKPLRLLMPSAESQTNPPPPLAAPLPDPFTCYRIRHHPGTPRFTPVAGVPLVDRFGSFTVEVKRPTMLCAPTDPDGQAPGADTHRQHLLCYHVVPTPRNQHF